MVVDLALPGQAGQPAKLEEFPKYFSRNSTLSIGFRADAITVECTDYPGWTIFKALLELAIDARCQVSAPDGVERIGLRYVDEIRVPGEPDGEVTWKNWVSRKLLNDTGLSHVIGLPETRAQGAAVYGSEPGQVMVIRYGAQEGFAVDPNGPLRKKYRDTGKFFLIDIDSYWTPTEGTPEFTSNIILENCEVLHHPIRSAFEHLITERLREEVLRVG